MQYNIINTYKLLHFVNYFLKILDFFIKEKIKFKKIVRAV